MSKQFEHQQSDTSPTSIFHFKTWFCLGLIVCLLVSGYLWDSYMSPKTIVTTTKVVSVSKTSNQSSSGITAEYRETNKLTWHHHQDCKTMLLIPSDIHSKTGHTGGLAIIKASQ
jgi:hypothetical protein